MKEIHSKEDFFKEVKKKEGYVLIDLHVKWCRPCQVMEPTFAYAETLFKDVFSFCRLDVEDMEEEAKAFGIPGYPAFVMVKNGEKIGEIIGYHTKNRFIEEIKKIINHT